MDELDELRAQRAMNLVLATAWSIVANELVEIACEDRANARWVHNFVHGS